MYIDPPLQKPGTPSASGKITIQQLRKLQINHLIPAGFLFVWMEKELIPDVLLVCESWGFHYVENFCWVRFNVNNMVAREPSMYFNKSHLTLLMLRKVHDGIEWRRLSDSSDRISPRVVLTSLKALCS
jgi:hypothetical protein